ncbi:probable GPI-anchored adhesin-like protein PGA55 [Thrips palmi]|uniref:Probable GPI-anchored adhesin-like protein PGA55 n=1 Tax=Thrips palmi TaxID=161013 RepID=A0A6P8YJR0_THRPL|nr:probable GPI-anchored adhesin-like protein PGA55 [Thrips palmi]
MDNDEATQILSEDEDIVYTGLTCSQAEGYNLENVDATEILSQDPNVVYTGQTCTEEENNRLETSHGKTQFEKCDDGSFDPDETYISVNKLRLKAQASGVTENKPNICDVGEEHKSVNGNEFKTEQSNLSSYSQELTQPVTQSQEIDHIDETPPISKTHEDGEGDSTSKSVNDTLELTPSQDIQNSLSPTGFKELENRLSRGHTHDGGHNVKTAVSSSSSSSFVVSTSSSSKRATESDDTDDMVIGSQDMFVSQEACANEPNVVSVSQLIPTLQLSGDIPLSQSYEGFKPGRLYPSSPTSGITSTPLREVSKSSRDDVISLSDEEDVQKISEKRKLSSDSSDELKPDLKKVKKSFQSRPSVMVVDEVGVFKNPSTEDLTLGSQGIHLHLSQTDSDLEGSQEVGIASPTALNGSVNPSHDISIVNVEDVEDDIQLISPLARKATAEITLDSSGHADIEEVVPLSGQNQKENTLSSKSEDPNLSNNIKSLVGDVGHPLDQSSENAKTINQTSQDFETDFVLTFTCTYKVSCKASIDTLKKNTTSRSITSFEVLESNTVRKRDSSPSAVEESSPGRNGSSPGSVMSGPGLFPLPPMHPSRYSMFSTTSSSSAGSAASLYRKVPARGRPPARTLHSASGNASPVRLNHLAPWKEFLSECQDELATSGSTILENWEASRMHNSSSDDSKTIDDKTLEPVLEDDNEILGIPANSGYQKYLHVKKRSDSANSSTSAAPVDSEKNPAATNEGTETPTSKRKRGRPTKPSTPRTPSGSSKKKGQTPRKKKTDVPDAVEHSSPPDDSLSGASEYYSQGAQVFALWKDGCYYHGRLTTSTKPNQWNVAFHDGTKRDLSKNEIYLINTFVIGQSVHAKTEKDYDAGTVIDVIPGTEGQDELYKIKIAYSGSVVTVHISDLMLSEEQMKQFVDPSNSTNYTSNSSTSPSKRSSASKLGSIDLDNILPGKRVRTPKGSQNVVNSPGRPGPSNTARRLIPEGCSSSTAEDEPLAQSLTIPIIPGVQAEQVGFEKTADPLARKGRGVKKSASKKPLPDIDDEKIVHELGPLPPDGSRIFGGYSFLLTITDVCIRHRHEPVTDSERNTDVEDQPDDESSHCASDYECYQFAKARMVKDRLARQILQGGGKVLKHWTEIVPKDINNTYVVSNRPCYTAIYLQCLVRGVKGVNHECIIHCCRENKRLANCLKSYLLPPGYSLKRKNWATWSDLKIKQPLRGEKILVEGDKVFKDFWEGILQLSGAKVATIKSVQGHLDSLSKVLSTHDCSEKTLKHAQGANVPIVSPLWVIQSLIENKPLPHNDIQCFAYDHVDCD